MSNKALKKIRWPLLLAALLLLAGCPYGSEFPLGSPEEAILDEALLGTWEAVDGQDEEPPLTIRSAGDRLLLITSEDSAEEEAEPIPAFVSELEGERFLNIRDARQYFYARYKVQGDRLLLRIVDEELFEGKTFSSTEELRAFVRANLTDPRLYAGEDCQELERVSP